MAATDMSKAGLEVGCKIALPDPDALPFFANHTERYRRMIRDMRKISTHWVYAGDTGPGTVSLSYENEHGWMNKGTVVRDYDDAQKARQERFEKLYEQFPGDAGVPEETDTIERYVCVLDYHGREHETVSGVQQAMFTWGDTFDECAALAANEVLDRYLPVGMYDLDTGTKIDLHISSPTITRSEDQGATINELNADEVAEAGSYMDRHPEQYDHIADTVTLSATVDPEDSAAFQVKLHSAADAFGLNFYRITAERIVQVIKS